MLLAMARPRDPLGRTWVTETPVHELSRDTEPDFLTGGAELCVGVDDGDSESTVYDSPESGPSVSLETVRSPISRASGFGSNAEAGEIVEVERPESSSSPWAATDGNQRASVDHPMISGILMLPSELIVEQSPQPLPKFAAPWT